jgi:hypothetical protein
MALDFESSVSANSTTRAMLGSFNDHAQDHAWSATSGDALTQSLQRRGGVNELSIDASNNTGLSPVAGVPSLKV